MRVHAVIVLATLPLAAAAPVQAARVQIILDVSGSMRAPLGPETRMDAARKAIRATLAGIQPDSVVALRLYGHRVSQDDKAGSCRDTELTVPFKPLDKAAFLAVVDNAVPRGQTPLTYAVEQAARDFGPVSNEERVIILVTDGAESCGGDPTAAARALQAQGFKLKVHTIGFDVDAAARAQLEALSTATGGEYHDARNAAALAESLTRLAQKSQLVAKADDAFGQPIRGGDSHAMAVALQPGQLHRLDHHQRKGQYDYFYVDTRPNQKVTAFIEAHNVGISIAGNSFREMAISRAGLELQDSTREKLATASSYGQRERRQITAYPAAERAGRVYVLVGSSEGDQHKDSRFQVSVVARPGDAGSSGDAGGSEGEALPIAVGSHKGQLAVNDKADVFKFTADPKATYEVGLRSSDSPGTNLSLKATSADAEVSKSDVREAGSSILLKELRFPRGGDVFVEIAYQTKLGGPDETDYTLVLMHADGSSGAASGATTAQAGATTTIVSFILGSGVPLMLGLVVGATGGYLLGRRKR